jgi:hypothetical protein
VRFLGVKTYSAAVNAALAEVVRVKKIQDLPSFFGSKIWEGDLSRMREDGPQRKAGRQPRKAAQRTKAERK